MKSYHFITFTAANRGEVTLKLFSDSDSSQYRLLRDTEWVPRASELPEVIPPAGLSPKRQWYLHYQIREFCRAGTEDLVCPLPAVPLPANESEESDVEEVQPPKRPKATFSTASPSSKPRRPRCCGKCGKPGHTTHVYTGLSHHALLPHSTCRLSDRFSVSFFYLHLLSSCFFYFF